MHILPAAPAITQTSTTILHPNLLERNPVIIPDSPASKYIENQETRLPKKSCDILTVLQK